MNILVVGDLHLRATSPCSRVDNILETFWFKARQVVDIVKSRGVCAVIFLGDVFDSPSPSLSVVWEFLNFVDLLRVPVYTIVGNHDVYGYNLETLRRCQLGQLSRLGAITLITSPTRVCGRVFGVFPDSSPCDVLLVHDFLLPFEFFGKATLIDEFTPPPGCKLVLVGHYHHGFAPVTRDGVVYFGPGALLRLDRSERERDVGVALLDCETLDFEFIKLHKPENVFLEVVEEKAADEVVSKILDLKVENLNVHDIIFALASQNNVPEKIVERLVQYLEVENVH